MSSDSRPQKDSTECESYEGVQTFMDMAENNLKEVQFERGNLLEFILSPYNLNRAYLQVKRNHGSCGVDGLSTEELGGYLKEHKGELVESLKSGRYRPNPVLRVEIPKDNGKKRPLGIPTVVDKVIQQAISQILSPIYERQFSDNSFGFRPHRSCHKALKRAQEYITGGYKYCVSLDLERFFDTVNHSMLIRILSRTLRDGRVISLIHKYLTAGVMVERNYEESVEGVPQGGPLSPLLANIMLNELDRELARRGHKFVRYADDCMILCRSKRAVERVRDSISTFIESRLHLKVNREKTEVSYVGSVKYLGYSFYMMNGKCRLRLHPKTVMEMKSRLKELTSRSNGWGYAKLKDKLNRYINGWLNYFKLADMRNILQTTDEWLRRRIRSYVWKSWKKIGTKFKNLMKCGIDRWRAWQWANTRSGYWNVASSPILNRAMNNERLKLQGYPCLVDLYIKLHQY
ncbi:MAG TPA: group II intron reverse transcriptase/maturase [Candidatus Bacteroides merdigallinarum]|uniref:RNA-directed DNA polymerase n=1 Tax=Candidatus Bacteroides merdigallinarum TaxID=2838473 RepID=A0A9D2E9Y5_9BACE|nr:group II intron reverse transcriptase/maturase [Candidatus Bacteroides merdigallinarum]